MSEGLHADHKDPSWILNYLTLEPAKTSSKWISTKSILFTRMLKNMSTYDEIILSLCQRYFWIVTVWQSKIPRREEPPILRRDGAIIISTLRELH